MINKKKNQLDLIRDELSNKVKYINKLIEKLGLKTEELNKSLNNIQKSFDQIKGIPNDDLIKLNEYKEIRSNWEEQVEKIQNDFKNASIKNASAGSLFGGVGVGIATLAPTAAMGIATTFGVASTGTAISTLSGAAATNAALAWIGGGALAAGGGGMAAGSGLLALAGPIGWTIAGVSILTSGLIFFKSKNEKDRIQNIFELIGKRDLKSYDLTIVELNTRLNKIDTELPILKEAAKTLNSFGVDYKKMDKNHKLQLGTFVNLMNATTQLLTNPIQGLKPKFDEMDYHKFMDRIIYNPTLGIPGKDSCSNHKKVVVALSNLLYDIKLEGKDKTIFWNTLQNNTGFFRIN